MGHQLGECKEKQEDGDIVWPGSNGRCVSDGGGGLRRGPRGKQSRVFLLNGKTGIHLKVVCWPTAGKRREDKAMLGQMT